MGFFWVQVYGRGGGAAGADCVNQSVEGVFGIECRGGLAA